MHFLFNPRSASAVKLQIYILCRDRPEFAVECIASVLNNSSDIVEIIISDNSVGDDVSRLINENFSGVRHIRRDPTLSSSEHFRTIVREASAEYLVMFHDDDVMMPGFVNTLLPIIESDRSVSAIASNAEVIDFDGRKTRRSFFRNNSAPLVIKNSCDLVSSYKTFGSKNGAAPFPAYMYRRSRLKAEMFNFEHGGKYSDVSFLLKVLKTGPFVWLPEPAILYRVHDGNDSKTLATTDRLRLKRFLIHEEKFKPQCKVIKKFTLIVWFAWWKNKYRLSDLVLSYFSKEQGWRKVIIRRFLIASVIMHLDVWIYLATKKFKKLTSL